jgi:hypothetical protein
VNSRRPLTLSAALPDSPTLLLASLTGVFEASLTPQGENQFDCEPDMVDRIEAAIQVDHVATCGWPYESMCPRCFPPLLLIKGL